MDISGIILAGGKSTRMGKNKALLEIGGLAMIERVIRVVSPACTEIIIAGGENEFGHLGYPIVQDIYPGFGPLSGLHAGLSAAMNHYSFVTACDVPFLDGGLIKKMVMEIEEGYGAVILKAGEFLEPLFSIYGKEFVKAAESCILSGQYKVTAPLALVRWKTVTIDPEEIRDLNKLLLNVNTPDEYEKAKKVKEKLKAR
ncbi:MAG: molybdenum cofactor guanylyltransferase [Desulfocucumaceae bacterium]